MDFVKPNRKLGIEVQFGKYAFMVYNVCAKMTIFSKMGVIDTGIEIVPVKNFADEMSTGVSYFEQFAWDLEHRGTSNIDIPVLILGIDAYSLFPLKLDRQKVAGTLMATGKTGFFGCTLLGSDGSKGITWRSSRPSSATLHRAA